MASTDAGLWPGSAPGEPRLPFHAISEVNGRENNEDSFIIFQVMPNASNHAVTVLALADGMGGHAHGELASSEALRRLARYFFEQMCIEPALNTPPRAQAVDMARLEAVLLKAVADTNAQVRRIIEANNWGQSGCTLVVALICGNEALVTNLGDSPLFHYNSVLHEFTKITDDHNETGVLLRAGLIGPDMARVHEGRSRLVHYIGMESLPDDLPLHRLTLMPGDRLLLGSDGVSGDLTLSQLGALTGQAGVTLEKISSELIAAARAAGETDNQTVILWQHPDEVEVALPPDAAPN
jgi:protein phosphatase